jgi:hypothetical protein
VCVIYKMTVSDLTIENLKQGNKTLQLNPNSDGKGELERFFENKKTEVPQEIFKLSELPEDEAIDCNKYNYYREEKMGKFGRPYFVKKIDSVFGCNNEVKRYDTRFVYRVERKDRPMTEGLKSGFTSFFKKSTDAPAATTTDAAPAGDANAAPAPAPTSGGRRSRNQRKSRRSRKQRNQRKSRRSRR